MKNKKLFIFFFCIIFCVGIIFFIKIYNRPISIENKFSNLDIKNIMPNKTIYFEDFGLDNITCTGLTFDTYDNSFWIADYGKIDNSEKKPRIIEIDSKFNKVIKIVNLDKINSNDFNLQGIAYDERNNNLFLATGNYVYNIDKEGNVIKKIDLGIYKKYSANGISYDISNDTIWVLMYYKYLLHYDKNGNLLGKIKFNYKDQDHIYTENNILYASMGADYAGNNNFVLKYDLTQNKVEDVYRVENSFAIEGIYLLNNKLYVVNDGYFHSAKIKKSYINIYNF